ncbi:MAG TPA: sugar porter family MFS transporter [Terriglobia bacterium]|nr:sugar porter family MFS transporter [Terriglobia bacterium]
MNVPVQTNSAKPAANYNVAFTWTISLVAALGGLLFGYDWVVIGGAKPFYEKFFNLTNPSEQGWAMSCALVGCLIGAFVSGGLSDRFGRKRLLILAAALFAVSSVGTGMAHSFAAFVRWRISGGVAIGLASNLSPMYIAEVSPAHVRGKMVSVNQLTIVVGILLAQFVNWMIANPVPLNATAQDILNSWNGQIGWRWMFGVTAIPALVFFAGMLAVPESPRWLAKTGRREKALAILQRIGGAGRTSALADIEASLGPEPNKTNFRSLFDPAMAGALLLGVGLAVFQQWCGINVIFNYAQEVFSAAGYKVSDILFNIVLTGAVNLLFTLVAMSLVDRAGRRVLMLIGSAGLTVIYTALGAGYHAGSQGILMLILVVAAIACYAMSLAPVTWVVISEIFPNRIRGGAMSLAVMSLWIACFVLTYTFPLLNSSLGPAMTFWIYAAVCALGFLFINFRLPETKGKTLEEIERYWGRRREPAAQLE